MARCWHAAVAGGFAWLAAGKPLSALCADRNPPFSSKLAFVFEIWGSFSHMGGMAPRIAAGRGPENASPYFRSPKNQTRTRVWN